MKFCKDCKHYSPAGHAGFLAAWPATCQAQDTHDPVTGESRITGVCDQLRADADKCGANAKWFDPVNLDGRLAMLEETEVQPKE